MNSTKSAPVLVLVLLFVISVLRRQQQDLVSSLANENENNYYNEESRIIITTNNTENQNNNNNNNNENEKEDNDEFIRYAIDHSFIVNNRKTIILTVSTYSYRNLTLNWLTSMKKLGFTPEKNIALICTYPHKELSEFLTNKILSSDNYYKYQTTKSNPLCFKGSEKEWKVVNNNNNKLTSPGKLWKMRFIKLRTLVKLGYDVVLSDLDAIWMKNPFIGKDKLFTIDHGDIVTSRAKFPFTISQAWGSTACLGVIYFASTEKTIDLLSRAWYLLFTNYTDDDQVAINQALANLARTKGNLAQSRVPPIPFVSKEKISPFSNNDAIGIFPPNSLKVRFISHSKIPRFCGENSNKQDIFIAHCSFREEKENINKKRKSYSFNNNNLRGVAYEHQEMLQKYGFWFL